MALKCQLIILTALRNRSRSIVLGAQLKSRPLTLVDDRPVGSEKIEKYRNFWIEIGLEIFYSSQVYTLHPLNAIFLYPYFYPSFLLGCTFFSTNAISLYLPFSINIYPGTFQICCMLFCEK